MSQRMDIATENSRTISFQSNNLTKKRKKKQRTSLSESIYNISWKITDCPRLGHLKKKIPDLRNWALYSARSESHVAPLLSWHIPDSPTTVPPHHIEWEMVRFPETNGEKECWENENNRCSLQWVNNRNKFKRSKCTCIDQGMAKGQF